MVVNLFNSIYYAQSHQQHCIQGPTYVTLIGKESHCLTFRLNADASLARTMTSGSQFQGTIFEENYCKYWIVRFQRLLQI
ncbi:hypothetical protein L596_025494 [Steinernema carpocapsae]|uniref:Uncharacterized protein n=1 Tax=Steinernema carpocapsae TaxID=34508 RepID=A0A4U5M7Y0_STECR|nr:hypothetical protein L596_025494 [Steinernema carpocapsae]